MRCPPSHSAVVHHLNAALVAEADDEKNFHVRQALQILSFRGYPVA
jgi:hypothetical protein